MSIDRGRFCAVAGQAVATWFNECLVEGVADNINEAAAAELVDGYMRALTVLNGKKPAGEIKTQLLNALRDDHGLDLVGNEAVTTEAWESAAWEAYCKVYPVRFNQDALLEAASRILRSLGLYVPLPPDTLRTHYQPDRKLVEAFWSKVKAGHFGEPTAPDAHADGHLKDLDDGVAMQNGMFPLTLVSYQAGEIPTGPE
jgi:hypothetical protein